MSTAEDLGGSALVEALDYVAAGYKIGPVTVRLVDGDKRALFHTKWSEPGGISDDPDQVMAWARDHPGCGFHAPTEPNGFVVAEGDVKTAADGRKVKDGITAWRRAGGPRSTMTVTTRSGGEHWYFRAPTGEPIGNSAKAIEGIPDVDVRGNRPGGTGTVFISGTVVQGGGGHYSANRIVPPGELPELSERWAERLRRAGPRGEKSRSTDRSPRPEGARTSGLVAGGAVHDAGWIEAKVDDELRELTRRGQHDFRNRLFGAAAIAYRAVEAGVLDQAEADDRLRDAIVTVWGSEPDRDDRQWLAEARNTAAGDPWRVAREQPPAESTGPVGTAETPVDLDRGLAAPQGLEPVDVGGGHDEDQGEGDEDDDGLDPEERALRREVDELRRRQAAQRRLAAEDAPPMRWLDFDEFLDSPEPEPIVPGVFYRDSLSRIVGAPGCGKSFLSLDLALSVALGRDWSGEPVEQGPVVYVMAEGQRVNTQRAKAWLDRHRVDRAELAGRFYTVPDAVLLIEEGVTELVRRCEELQPALVILDTKNAMMVGEENSGTDSGVMRRALDAIRKVSDACVVLIDHTGKAGGDDGRGSNAVKAAMDTQLLVENDGGRPALVTVKVVRDKAAEAGREWHFYLRMHERAAVLLSTEDEPEERVDRSAPDWRNAEGVVVPTDLLHYEGAGAKVMPLLARFMAHEASPRHGDPNGTGVSRAEATRAMKAENFEDTSVRRAWSALIRGGWIDRAEKVTTDTGRHVWTP